MKIKLQLIIILFTCFCYSQDFELDDNFGNFTSPSYLAFDYLGTDYFRKVISNDNDMLYYVGYTASPLTVTVTSTTANGNLNPNFGGDFTKFFQVPDANSNTVYNSAGEWIRFQGDKLIIGVRFIIPNTNVTSISVCRLNSDGTLDTTFADNGYFNYAPSGIDTYFGALAINNNDEIFIGGRYRVGSQNYEYLIVKLTSNGDLDTSFSDDGILIFKSFSSSQWISAIECLDNGQILIAGTENDNKFFMLNADGSFDGTFGQGNDLSNGLPVDIKDIKPIADGFLAAGTNRNNLQPTIFKFNSTTFDNSFGTNGVATSDYAFFMEDAFINDNEDVFFVSNGQSTLRIFKTETTNGAIPFDTDNFKLFTDNFNFTIIYGITQLTDGSIIGAGSGLNLINNNTTGVDKYAIKLNDTNLSTLEVEALNFDFFPNPVNDYLSFETSINAKLNFYTLDGKLVSTKHVNNSNSVSLKDLNQGLYLVEITTQKGKITKKLIKN